MPPICPGTGLPSQSVRDHGAPPTQNPAMPTLSFAIQEQYNSHSKPNNPHRPTKIHHIFTRTPSSSVSDSPSRSRSHQPNPTQSTILTQSTCNLGIPLQSVNIRPAKYRTSSRWCRTQTATRIPGSHRDCSPPAGSGQSNTGTRKSLDSLPQNGQEASSAVSSNCPIQISNPQPAGEKPPTPQVAIHNPLAILLQS